LVIRHGPTAWNERGRIQGRTDIPLSPAGRKQVSTYRIPDEFRDWSWISSPARRARETATILAGLEPPVDARLIEMDWGAWEGETLPALREKHGAALAANEGAGLDFRPPSGESPRDVQARLKPWLEAIAASGRPSIAVTHKGVIRALYSKATDWPMIGKAPDRLLWDHAHLFLVSPGGRPSLARINIRLIP
jgi:probable phosphoglycerate mutase